MATKYAVALRAFDHEGDSFAPGPAFPISAGHLADWSGADMVREATVAEIAKVKSESGTTDKPARRVPAKRGRKPKASVATPPAGSADPAPANPDPAAIAA
jgi:hypothetical protein